MNEIVTIKYNDVVEIINDNSMGDRLTRKCDILDNLRLEDTKENRKILTKVTDGLKNTGIIYTTYGLIEDDVGYRGRGYMMVKTRFSGEVTDGTN